MTKRYRYFYLNNFIVLVKGTQKGALYDLIRGNVYSIDGRLANIISDNYPKRIDEILQNGASRGFSNPDLIEVCRNLNRLGVCHMADRQVYIDRCQEFLNPSLYNKHEKIILKRVLIQLTSECNIACLFCNSAYWNQICFPCRRRVDRKESLDEGLVKYIIDIVSLFGCESVNITGGNPFLWDGDIYSILNYLNHKKMRVELFSNLNNSTDLINIKELKKINNLTVVAPIFSIDTDLNDHITGTKNSLNGFFKNVSYIIENGVKLRIIIPALTLNHQKIYETKSYLIEKNLDFRDFHSLSLEYRTEDFIINEGPYYISNSKFSRISFYDFYLRKNWNRCWSFECTITADGKVRPCLYSDYYFAQISKDSLINLFRSRKLESLWKLSKDKVMICKNCEFRYLCPDCRVVAKNISGRFDAKYPFCSYNPKDGTWTFNS
ncbi:MAG: radical SAM protein [Candidatus Aminicenantes bacterium]|nr:radical SAM protein [Candidatus Aminicenantes bacterium]